jgi:hypothetical protein
MEAAWRALAIEHDWLNGEIVETPEPIKASGSID